MTARRRLAIAACVALIYALAFLRLAILEAPRVSISRHAGFAFGQFVFALVGVWAGLGITWSQRAVALGIAAAVAFITTLSRELLGYAFMGVSVFATVVAWQYLTWAMTVAALTVTQPAPTTKLRYRLLVAWLLLTVTFGKPLMQWLQPPVPIFLLWLVMLPMVPCALTPRHHIAVGTAAGACLGLSVLVWPDPSNPFDYKVAFAAVFGLIAAAFSLVVTIPFALHTRGGPKLAGPLV